MPQATGIMIMENPIMPTAGPAARSRPNETSKPTRNMKIATPTDAIPLRYGISSGLKMPRCSLGASWPKRVGPSRMPMKISPITRGWPNRSTRRPANQPVITMIAMASSNRQNSSPPSSANSR